MVQVVENWAEVVGTVSDVATSDRGPDWRVVVVDVSSGHVGNVGGWPNLVRSQVSSERRLVVTCPADPLKQRDIHPGQQVRGRARLAGPGQVLAHPDGFAPVTEPA
jgi:hypothetical protein